MMFGGRTPWLIRVGPARSECPAHGFGKRPAASFVVGFGIVHSCDVKEARR
jgi:hypothetical protein